MTAALPPTMSSDHRPHLDGVRAVAVYLVIAFHAGIARFRGGHIGVDVFFVLSGYLVTGVLLRDLTRDGVGDARVRFGRFYASRVRRLLPAAIVCLVGTAVAFTALASRAAVLDSVDGFRAAALYLTNWYLISTATDYFAADTDHSPILHFWSLAVEEQFYLLWPLLFAGLAAGARVLRERRWQAVRLVVGAASLASLLWALHLRSAAPDRAYYGTDARAYQLLAGALLALSPGAIRALRRFGRWSDVLAAGSVAGLVVLSLMGRWGPIERGAISTVGTVVLLAALESGAARRSAAVLGSNTVAFLGAISYATYLWHWPLIVLAQIVGDFSPGQLLVVSGVGASGLAALSFRVLEAPIRRGHILDRWAGPVAIAGLAVSVLAGLLVLPKIATPDDERRAGASASSAVGSPGEGATPIPDWFDYEAIREAGIGHGTSCLGKPVSDCEVVTGDSDRRVLLFGDSTALMWAPAFEGLAQERGITLYVDAIAGCPWERARPPNAGDEQTCTHNRDDAYARVVDEVDPDFVYITSGAAWDPDAPPYGPSLVESAEHDVEALLGDDRTVVMLELMPIAADGRDPLECLSEAVTVEECRFVTYSSPNRLERLYRRLAEERDRTFTVDLDRLVCPHKPICDPLLGGRAVYWNVNHITVGHAAAIGPALGDLLDDAALLP